MAAETVSGIIEHIIFRNDENGYTVMNVVSEGEDITCVGNFPEVFEGEYLEAEGRMTVHGVYGPQFHVNRYEKKRPDRGAAFARYLGSGAVKGIGEKLAARIIKKFGDDTARILQEEPERLAEVKGISERKARAIGEQMLEQAELQNAMAFLAQYDISTALGIRIFNRYQDDLYRVFRENPYQLAEDIEGIGFQTADRIAYRAGISRNSEFRIRSGLLYVMSRASAEGHTCLPKEELLRQAEETLGVPAEMIRQNLADLVIDRKLVIRNAQEEDGSSGGFAYLSRMYFLELNTARMLTDLNVYCGGSEGLTEARIRSMEKEEGIVLDELQKKALRTAAESGLMILTGGPGTGKTTTIRSMIRYFVSAGLDVALAAPTGRAARRMTEATGYEASTVHRLLEISGGRSGDDPGDMHFGRNEENPLEADVVIIDEASMMDIFLLHALLLAIVPGTHLIFAGDVNQLPSVGPGAVLKDMIGSRVCEVVRLEHIFRQAAQSDIVLNAHRINRGEAIYPDNHSRDFFFLERSDVRVIQKACLTLMQKSLPGYVGAGSYDIQVLTPMRKGALGAETLNVILQRYMNPPEPGKRECESGGRIFREGDKVMQIRNNYQIEWVIRGKYGIVGQRGQGIFNGDLGRIRAVDPESETVEVEFDEDRTAEYSFRELDELDLAYAVTIHKAQGSEYPAVVIPLLAGPPMLMTRNLLYTAVTRARRCVVLVGSQEVFRSMIRNETEQRRYTSLKRMIGEMKEIQGGN